MALDPFSLSPAFEIDNYECNDDGTYNVIVAATDIDSPNHWWRLRETTQQGETQGGTSVGSIQNDITATFFNLDPDKFYYISHGVWDDCTSFTTEEVALDFSPPPLSPAFEIVNSVCTSEEDGTYDVTVTATDINSPNHWWRLRETTQQGETQGGTSVGNTQNGVTATFSNLDSNKFYYISHGVWSGCVSFTTEELVLDSPCIGYIIKAHDCSPTRKNRLIVPDITSMDEGLVEKTCDPCIQGYSNVYLADSNGNLIDASSYDSILWSNGDTTIETKAFPEEPISVVVTYRNRIYQADYLLECNSVTSETPRGNDPKSIGKTMEVKISPNPNVGEMNINVLLENDSNITLNIYKLNGVLVKTMRNLKTTNGVFNMDFQSNLLAGLYIFNFSTDEETIIKKVIIK